MRLLGAEAHKSKLRQHTETNNGFQGMAMENSASI